MPEVFLERVLTALVESILLPLLLVLTTSIHCVLIDGRLGVGFGIVHDRVEESVGVELEDRGVRVLEAEVGREGSEAGVPVGDGARRDRVAPLAGEGHAVERGDIEDEKVTGAVGVELLGGKRVSLLIFEIGKLIGRESYSPVRARARK